MNRKNVTRNTLLTSILSLLLCVSMLVGTTFAWFTDSVTSGPNIITAGKLDIELYNAIGINDAAKVDSTTKLFDNISGDLWEPGAVAWENLTVANVGNLALKYTLELNVLEQTETTVEGTTYKLSDAIKVGLVDGGITATTRAAVINAVEEWETLTDFALNMTDEELTAGAMDTFGIVLYWEPGENDNIFNLNNGRLDESDLKLEIGVALTATQAQKEKDSFSDNYDAMAGKDADEGADEDDGVEETVQTAAEKLQAALNAGGTVTLTEDIALTDTNGLNINGVVTLNLNGHKITANGDALVVTGGTLTINGDGTVAAGTSGTGSWTAVWANGGNVVINGGTYSVGGDTDVAESDPTHQNDVIYTKNGGTVTVNGGTFLNDGTVWTLNENDSNRGTITVTGGTFQSWNPADNVSEGAGTSFVADGYAATAETKDGETWYTVAEKTETDPEPVTVTASVVDDTYVDSSNKDKGFTDKEDLNTYSNNFRTYLRVNISNHTALEDDDQVKLVLTVTSDSITETTTTLKTYTPTAGVTDIAFSEITWNSVDKESGTYSMLHWSSGITLNHSGAVNEGKITLTLTYSEIADYIDENGNILFAFGTKTDSLKVGSLENTDEANQPLVNVIQD